MALPYVTKIKKLTHLGFYLNGAAGSGKYDHLTVDKVKDAIDGGKLFEFINSELGDDLDHGILEPAERAELLEEWSFQAQEADESRKMCVVRGGLNLLVAYLLDSIQKRVRD